MQAVSQAISDPSCDDSPWLLQSLLAGSDRRYWPLASFVLGLLGAATFAIAASAAAGVYISWAARWDPNSDEWIASVSSMMACLPMVGAYVSVLFVLQLIGSLRLPVTVRLSLIYATLYMSLAAILAGFDRPANSLNVLLATPFCLGSFVQHRFGRWSAVSWNQSTDGPSKVSIATLLDFTAAIALTLWLVRLSDDSVSVEGSLCLLPASCLLAVIGMHVWARLMAISTESSSKINGLGVWMAGNVSIACLICLGFAIVVRNPRQGLIGMVGAALIVFVAHWWTEIPIRWLRGCGWRLVRSGSESLSE